MPNDLSIRPAALSVGDIPRSAERSGVATSSAFTVATQVQSDVIRLPNPHVHIDPALNIVVIQMQNDAGQVTVSMPTAQQLQAYARNGLPASMTGSVSGLPETVASLPASGSGAGSSDAPAAAPVHGNAASSGATALPAIAASASTEPAQVQVSVPSTADLNHVV